MIAIEQAHLKLAAGMLSPTLQRVQWDLLVAPPAGCRDGKLESLMSREPIVVIDGEVGAQYGHKQLEKLLASEDILRRAVIFAQGFDELRIGQIMDGRVRARHLRRVPPRDEQPRRARATQATQV